MAQGPEPAAGDPVAPVTMRTLRNFRPVVPEAWHHGGVYRSGLLLMSTPGDRNKIAKLGITQVIDLRTPRMIARLPDPRIRGVRQVAVDIYTVDAPHPPLQSPDDTIAVMEARYRAFVAESEQRAKLAEVLRLIAHHDGGSLVHCTDGKDRTGWVCMLIQHAAGSDEATLMSWYLESMTRLHRVVRGRHRYMSVLKGRAQADIRRPHNIVQESFLRAGLREVRERFGTVDTYLSEGLGLTAQDVDGLRRASLGLPR